MISFYFYMPMNNKCHLLINLFSSLTNKIVLLFTGSPFGAKITPESADINNVTCHGPGIEPKGVRQGEKAIFTIDATKATTAAVPQVFTTDLTTSMIFCFIKYC